MAERGVLSSEKDSLIGVKRELEDEETDSVGEDSEEESAGVWARGSRMSGAGMACEKEEVPVML